MVGLHRPIFGRDRGALDQRQQIALHALARDGTAAHVGHRDLVDFIEEHDPVRLGIGQGGAADLILVEALVGLFLDELVPGRRHRQLAAFELLVAERLAHHFGQVDHLRAAAGQFERHVGLRFQLDLDLGVAQMAVVQPLAERLARRLARALAGQRIEQTAHRGFLGLVLDGGAATFLFEPYRFLDQIARNLLDVATDIAHLGEFGRLDLDERRIGQLGETAADLGLAAAGRPDHQDVLRRDLVAQFGRELLAAPAVAHRDRDRTLGVGLADDVRIERCDNGFGSQGFVHWKGSVAPAEAGAAMIFGRVLFASGPGLRRGDAHQADASRLSTVSRSLV